MDNNLLWVAHIFFIYIAVFFPVLGLWNYFGLYKELFEDKSGRVLVYKKTIVLHSLQIVAVVLVLLQFSKPLKMFSAYLPTSMKVVPCLIALTWAWIMTPKKADDLTIIENIKNVISRLPKDFSERWLFIGVSITTGISQELIYRGFLIFYLSNIFPVIHVYVAIIVSSILYGARRFYFGWKNVLWNFLYGLVMSALYLAIGNIALPIIVGIYFILSFWQPDYWVR